MFTTELGSSKFRKAVPLDAVRVWQADSDEDLIDTGRCRRTKLCKVAGFRLKLSADRAMLSSGEIANLSKMIIDRGTWRVCCAVFAHT